jgi:hypothetical protein
MSLICSLPKDLFHSLLLSWLEHADVGRLDSALCNIGERKQFLCSVRASDFVLLKCQRPIVEAGANRLDLLLKWLVKRRIATSQLPVTNSCVSDCDGRLSYLKRSGKHVHEVIIRTSTASFDMVKAAIEDVCVHCPNILILENNSRIRNYSPLEHTDLISTIASHCAQLRNLYTCFGLTDHDLAALGAGCPHLTTVEMMDAEVTDDGIQKVARNGALRTLCVEGCVELTDEGLQAVVAFCPLLESVDLSACDELTDATLIAIGQHCPNLRELNIVETDVTDEGLQAIAAGCPLLETLNASQCDVGPAIEDIARGCPNLRVLIVTGVEVTAEAVQALAECCPRLEELGLCRCEEIGDEEITTLVRGCLNLTKLSITRTAVTELGLCAIREHCTQLTRIALQEEMYPNGVRDDSFFPAGVEVAVMY